MNKSVATIASVLALALCAGGAYAQDKKDKMKKEHADLVKNFKAADKNHDGGLSKDELGDGKMFPNIRDHFDEMDTNKDGKVTMKEHDAWEKKQVAAKKAGSTTSK